MLVVVLAVASASVGAGAAFLVRTSDGAQESTVQPAVSVTVVSDEDDPIVATAVQLQQPAAPADESTETVRAEPTSATTESASEQSTQAVEQPPAEPEPEIDDTDVAVAQPPATAKAPSTDAGPEVSAAITPDLITQGETVALTVESAEVSSIAATIGGRSWPLSEAGDGQWWGLSAIPRDADTGVTEVVIDLYGAGGVWLRSHTASLVVLASAAPFEEIVLGGAGTPADPDDVARDIAVRFVEHTAISGPPRWTDHWILPVEGEVSGVFGSFRSYDGVRSDGWHHGHDIAAQHGDPIVAPAPGVVVWTGELVLHGIGVIIDHGAGVYSGYWHMSLIAVREGMEVAPGDWLGNVGTTGLSTGPHLHWEVIVQGVDVDPVQWLGEDLPPLPLQNQVSTEDSAASEDTIEQ